MISLLHILNVIYLLLSVSYDSKIIKISCLVIIYLNDIKHFKEEIFLIYNKNLINLFEK